MTAVSAATLLAPTAAIAQSQTGSLRVTIAGSDGQPLAGATVRVSSPDSLISRSATTDDQGRARLVGLDPATNYTLEVTASGYDAFSAPGVAVVSGRELAVGYALGAATVDDIVVTGRALAAVDVTSATVGTTLNLDIVESLPTGRSYQSYLQLVPGVKPSSGGNPSSRSGINYSDVGGAIGASSDNVYYLDGVDVTDPSDGLFGANLNSEIIQEQQVIVGGVPAEYAGGSGLISRVVTKSGSNDWSGSINYYLQNDSLVAEDKHNTSNGFSTYDTAFTFGGPIIRDRLWFFTSYQKTFREDEVTNSTGDLMRTVERNAEYAFAKLTWQVTNNDRLSLSYFSDPLESSGSTNPAVLNNRTNTQTQGGDNYKVEYSRSWGDLLFNAYYFTHEGELSNVANDSRIRDNVRFRAPFPGAAERSLGGAGIDSETFRNRTEYGLSGEYYLDTSFGSHTFKAGYTFTENSYEEDSTVPGGATYESIGTAHSGSTLGSLITGTGWTGTPFGDGDENLIRERIEASPDRAYYMGVLDSNSDDELSNAEIQALQFTSDADNPYDQINAYRAVRAVNEAYKVRSEGKAIYLQDTWTMDQLTVNAGLRAEEWTHFDSTGDVAFTFDWEIAPRVSVVYDVFGDGRSKVFGFVGRYYDPIRNDMTDFAGGITGPVTNEQVFIGDRWLTFRVRGGLVTPDAVFAPTTKTPFTDEYMLGASTTLRDDLQLSFTATSRRTRDLMEDYALYVYSDPNAVAGGDYASPGSPLYLPYSYFGYDGRPNSNYVIGTLAGGKRNYVGYELTLQKFKTDNWQGMVSYTHNIAEGNSNSDGNADVQGDFIFTDPRAPNTWGEQPGNIKHQFKAFASYEFDFGVEVSGVFNWNSGAVYTPATSTASRYLSPRVATAYEWGGVLARWYQPGMVGSETGPAYYTFDVRLKYTKDMPVGEVEFFLDVFNALDNQAATSEQALLAGNGTYAYQDATAWVAPRRAYLGVRYSF
ncbi:MAG: TonB-dependent receptor [Brevundimonas sp.]|nr:MAG: TonB-dependent receptor [Brevundimonas sp.]